MLYQSLLYIYIIYMYIYIYGHSFFNILFHEVLSQVIEYNSLYYTIGPCCLSYILAVLISVLMLLSHQVGQIRQ